MNKTLKTMALVTAGVACAVPAMRAADASDKNYILSAGLRGFYDDNIFTGNNKTDSTGDGKPDRRKFDSFGMEVTPGIRFSVPLEQTTISAGVTYGLRYFADRSGRKVGNEVLNGRSYDQFVLADAQLNHRFSPGYKLDLSERFSDSQDPTQALKAAGQSGQGQVLRAEGNNVNNLASMDFSAQLTSEWSAVLGYRNSYFSYQSVNFSGLNRLENLPSLGLRYQWTPTTVVSANYQFGDIGYSDSNFTYRDSRSHYAFLGVDHQLTSRASVGLRGGVQAVEWMNSRAFNAGNRANAINPYVDASFTYGYATSSTVQLGVRHGRNSTDVATFLDQESTSGYASVNHQITGALRGTLSAQYQLANFVAQDPNALYSGTQKADHLSENNLSLGFTLSYKVNTYLSAETAYYFDRLSSDITLREYTRNRVFVGFRAVY